VSERDGSARGAGRVPAARAGAPGLDVHDADVVVVGAGPAGIAAAVTARAAGASVVLLDSGPRPGGQIWRHVRRDSLPPVARRWLARLDRSGALPLTGASVVDAAPGVVTAALAHGEGRTITARAIILATGARERFLPFPGWTLPGIMGVGGAQALLKAGATPQAHAAVVAGSGPLLLPVVAALAHTGCRVALAAEQAPAARVVRFGLGLWRSPARLLDAVRYRTAFHGARYHMGTWVAAAHGDERVREVTLTDGRKSWRQACDLLAVGYGLVPAVELPSWVGCRLDDGAVAVDPWQETSVAGVFCAGEPTGVAGVDVALVEGRIAGAVAAGDRQAARHLFPTRRRLHRFARRIETAFALRQELRSLPEPDTIVCRCEDITFGQIRPDWEPRQAKLLTRAGMGPCQGRVCGAALGFLFGWETGSVRAPVDAARLETLVRDSEPKA
jgi:D-hydroxyproline dehydrogenase subunit alpha